MEKWELFAGPRKGLVIMEAAQEKALSFAREKKTIKIFPQRPR